MGAGVSDVKRTARQVFVLLIFLFFVKVFSQACEVEIRQAIPVRFTLLLGCAGRPAFVFGKRVEDQRGGSRLRVRRGGFLRGGFRIDAALFKFMEECADYPGTFGTWFVIIFLFAIFVHFPELGIVQVRQHEIFRWRRWLYAHHSRGSTPNVEIDVFQAVRSLSRSTRSESCGSSVS